MAGGDRTLVHDPEKWEPDFGKDDALVKMLGTEPIQFEQIGLGAMTLLARPDDARDP